MLGNFGRRAIDLAVLFLALYAFAFVPLGSRTGLEHLQAIVHTDAARSAGRELLQAADRLRRRLSGELSPPAREPPTPARARGTPIVPRLPRHRVDAPTNALVMTVRTSDSPDASM